MNTLPTIEKIVQGYNALPADFNDIDRLTTALRRLACAVFEYSREVGEKYRDARSTEFQRKAAEQREKLRLIGEGQSAAAAESAAKAAAEKLQFAEIEADAEYRAAYLALTSANGVLDAIRQHISTLKSEKRLEMTGASQS